MSAGTPAAAQILMAFATACDRVELVLVALVLLAADDFFKLIFFF